MKSLFSKALIFSTSLMIIQLVFANICTGQVKSDSMNLEFSYFNQLVQPIKKGNWIEIKEIAQQWFEKEQNMTAKWISGYAGLATRDYDLSTKSFAHINSDQTNQIISYSEELINQLPENQIAQILRGDALSRNYEYVKAIEYLDKAIIIDRNSALAYDVRGTIYALSGNLENSESDFKKAIELDKDFANSYFNLGNIYLLRNEIQLAEEYFNKALILEPNFALASNGRGLSSLYQHDFEMAIYDFTIASEIFMPFIEYRNLEIIENLKINNEFDTLFNEMNIDERGGYIQVNQVAQPGDLIVRHGDGILGPPLVTFISGGTVEDIPHIGMVTENNQVYHLKIENIEGSDHGIMHVDEFNKLKDFKNPGFFSILDSDIPIKHEGKLMSFNNLPTEKKEAIRYELTNLALSTSQNEITRDKGNYSPTNHCGDAIMDLYDDVLKNQNITVQRYEGISAFTNNDNGLVNGKLRDWFVNDWLTAGKIMDPSEVNDKLPRKTIPYSTFDLDKSQIQPNYWVQEDNNINVAKNLVSMIDRGAAYDNKQKNVVVCGNGTNADIMIKDFQDKGWKVTQVPEYNNFNDVQKLAVNNNAIIAGVRNYKEVPMPNNFKLQEPKFEASYNEDFRKYKPNDYYSGIDNNKPPPPPGGVLMKVKIVRKEKANVNEMFGIKQEQDETIDLNFYCPFLIYCGR
jgi:tetratricopeptide (TPR) repeat protein